MCRNKIEAHLHKQKEEMVLYYKKEKQGQGEIIKYLINARYSQVYVIILNVCWTKLYYIASLL